MSVKLPPNPPNPSQKNGNNPPKEPPVHVRSGMAQPGRPAPVDSSGANRKV
jgi:hypothetical protein